MNLQKKIMMRLELAREGRDFWLSLEKNGQKKESTFVLLFPERSKKINDLFMDYLEDYFHMKNIKETLILSVDEEVCDLCSQNFSDICKCRKITEEESEKLIAYYCMQEFTTQLLIASLDFPVERHGSKLIGIQDVTMEEVVRIGILGLPE